MRRSHVTIILITVLALLTSACSSTRMAYRYADWGIVWWVEDFITLTDSQKAELSQSIDTYRQWHCSAELPRYADWLGSLEADISNPPLEAQDVARRQSELLLALDRMLVEAVPIATALLATLSDEQIDELSRNMAANQAEKEAEFLDPDPAVALQQREQRILERAERWLGSLNEEQKATIAAWNRARGDQTDIWLEGRARWQQALLAVLQERQSETFGSAMERLIRDSAEVRGERYEAMITQSRPALASLMSNLVTQSKPQQRSHLTTELAELRRDFEALTCEG
ncbi:DUF6279 family lipoprotein [Marinobacter changyiensis]|uniref:DUF6279 family lipoprotein n=1 Tax=Marinobacter changyiensis TaxID=2604091 RepID=UPI0012640C3C|nr:DUF6279 family lipoprotein [Marinobacter changyiensis]